MTKKNTFLDFCACAEHLVKSGLTAPDRLAISGASAGGCVRCSSFLTPCMHACSRSCPFIFVSILQHENSMIEGLPCIHLYRPNSILHTHRLLIGASVNMRPDLFKCALADVPFVDVATTMCDASIPLTVVEWEEWGALGVGRGVLVCGVCVLEIWD